ncbi:hypothetical protein LJC14_00495 [Treponema sp. OttesenSCG-928-L16]|nr:hypothetical protein [Treponema sp. OttesenSCG-928-L16]
MNDTEEKNSDEQRKTPALMRYFIILAVLTALLLGTLIFGLRFFHGYAASLEEQAEEALAAEGERLEEVLLMEMQERFDSQEALMAEQGEHILNELESLRDALGIGTNRTVRQIGETNTRIEQLEKVYAELLAEQQKKTLDSLYAESTVIAMEHEAAEFFKQEQYGRAYDLYLTVSEEQPENSDARFYMYYSLFLINRHKRDNYRTVRNGFSLLKQAGYTRNEMDEVLAYIQAEEDGTAVLEEDGNE